MRVVGKEGVLGWGDVMDGEQDTSNDVRYQLRKSVHHYGRFQF